MGRLDEEERNAAMEKARTARQRKLSKARRVEIARLAVNARWAKASASKLEAESTAHQTIPALQNAAAGMADVGR
jgi:hypothetical protein